MMRLKMFRTDTYLFGYRGVFDRQDSVRSEYTSDRESSRYGIVQQASIDSTDSRICYLTSSEVSGLLKIICLKLIK